MHAEHKEWTLWQEYTVASKFRGKYLVCYPIGSCHLMFHRSKSHYTWCKVATTIHNIIVGKLWVDQVRGGVFRGEVVGAISDTMASINDIKVEMRCDSVGLAM